MKTTTHPTQTTQGQSVSYALHRRATRKETNMSTSTQPRPRIAFARKLLGALMAVSIPILGITVAATVQPAAAVTGYHTTASPSLSERTGPGTSYATIGSLPYGTPIDIRCQVQGGTNVNGNATWDQLANGAYIADYWTNSPSFNSYITGVSACGTPSPSKSTMPSGSALNAGQALQSPNGLYLFEMQTDGNLVLYIKNGNGWSASWSSGTPNHPGAVTEMQSDGNLVVYSASWTPLFASGTSGHSGASLTVQDDGNVVIYSPSGPALWSTKTGLIAPAAAVGRTVSYNEGAAGQCTWWAINEFHAFTGLYPNLVAPGNNGDAQYWAGNATYNGWTVTSTPRVNAIAVFPAWVNGAGSVGHVAWVTGVSGAQITVTEMNFLNFNQTDTRTLTPAASVRYILAP